MRKRVNLKRFINPGIFLAIHNTDSSENASNKVSTDRDNVSWSSGRSTSQPRPNITKLPTSAKRNRCRRLRTGLTMAGISPSTSAAGDSGPVLHSIMTRPNP